MHTDLSLLSPGYRLLSESCFVPVTRPSSHFLLVMLAVHQGIVLRMTDDLRPLQGKRATDTKVKGTVRLTRRVGGVERARRVAKRERVA